MHLSLCPRADSEVSWREPLFHNRVQWLSMGFINIQDNRCCYKIGLLYFRLLDFATHGPSVSLGKILLLKICSDHISVKVKLANFSGHFRRSAFHLIHGTIFVATLKLNAFMSYSIIQGLCSPKRVINGQLIFTAIRE